MINPLSRITGILIRPKATYTEAQEDPPLFVFTLYLLILGLGMVLKIFASYQFLFLNPGMQAAREFDTVFNFLVTFAGALIGTGVLASLLRVAMKKQTFRPAARIFLYAMIPSAFFQLFLGVLDLFSYGGSPLAQAVGSASWLLQILIWIWTIALLVIGLRVLFRMTTAGAVTCAVAGFFTYYLLIMAMVLPVAWIPVTSGTLLLYKLQAVPVVLIAVFLLYAILEKIYLVQEQQNRFRDTQKFAGGAIVILIISFLFFPLYRHGRTTDMSQLSANLDMIAKALSASPGTLYLREAALIAVFGLILLVYLLHATGIIGRKTTLLASLLSFVYLGICGSIVAEWQEFYEVMDSRPVQPDWGTWVIPLVGIIYLLIVIFLRERPPAEEAALQT